MSNKIETEVHDNKHRGLEVGEIAPEWNLKGPDGKLIGLFRYFNQPLLMFFFRGTWCQSCLKQIEQIQDAWSEIEPLVQVVGIMRDSESRINEYLAEGPLPFPLIADPSAKVIQLHNVYQRFGLNGFRIAYPTTIILDRNHIVRYCYVGLTQFDRPEISEVLAELHKLNATSPKPN
jgi:peroxiredoxin Q/BCP